jgi:Subtilisin inhibitor-like
VRALLVLALLAAAVGYGAAAAGSATATELRLVVWPQGRDAPSFTRTLRCDPAGGTLRRPGEACRRLGQLERPFAPVPRGIACTQIWGGPQEALVTGTYRGRRVWARFNRSGGCEIARWNRHAFLFAG